MSGAFLRKLMTADQRRDGLADDDRALLINICSDVRSIRARRDIIREGDKPNHVLLMVEGWACRYKVLPDGSRQIVAFLIPGDFCDSNITLFGHMDHNIGAVRNSEVAFIRADKMMELIDRPRIARAFLWATLVDEAILRSWIVNLGRRDAFQRVGHLICELHARLRNVAMATDSEFDMPITQEDLADALGLTPIHVNRTLKRLRDDGLVTFRKAHIVIHDIARLQKSVGFDPNYLHLTRDGFGAYAGSKDYVRESAKTG